MFILTYGLIKFFVVFSLFFIVICTEVKSITKSTGLDKCICKIEIIFLSIYLIICF